MHRIAGLVLATALVLSAWDANEDLLAAARKGDLVTIKALIEQGAALETKTPQSRATTQGAWIPLPRLQRIGWPKNLMPTPTQRKLKIPVS